MQITLYFDRIPFVADFINEVKQIIKFKVDDSALFDDMYGSKHCGIQINSNYYKTIKQQYAHLIQTRCLFTIENTNLNDFSLNYLSVSPNALGRHNKEFLNIINLYTIKRLDDESKSNIQDITTIMKRYFVDEFDVKITNPFNQSVKDMMIESLFESLLSYYLKVLKDILPFIEIDDKINFSIDILKLARIFNRFRQDKSIDIYDYLNCSAMIRFYTNLLANMNPSIQKIPNFLDLTIEENTFTCVSAPRSIH